MIVLDKLVNQSGCGLAIAIGCFDGIHIGHRKIIEKIAYKKNDRLIPTVFTFKDNPKLMFGNEKAILSLEQKHKILSSMGIEIVYNVDFLLIKNLSPKEFVEKILVKNLNVKYIACGFNFTFGYKGSANAMDLSRLCNECGVDTEIIAPVNYEGFPISSTRIRQMISCGNKKGIMNLLGKSFDVYQKN